MSDPVAVSMGESGQKLSENVPSSSLWELLSLRDDSKKLSMLFYFHHVVKGPMELSIWASADTSHVKVNNISNMPVSCLQAHVNLI